MERTVRSTLVRYSVIFLATAFSLQSVDILAADEEADKVQKIYETLKETLPKIEFEGTSYWIVEGDSRLTADELREYAQTRSDQIERFKAIKQRKAIREINIMPRLLIQTNPLTGDLIRWAPGTNLKYCVLRATFPDQSEYDAVVNNMREATEDWEETCNIQFEYIVASDNESPGPEPPDAVLFAVRKFPLTGGTIASAFFPQDDKQERHLLIGPAYFTTGFNRVGVLRHELGHVIGFRHEHIRSEAPPACFTGEIPDTQTLPLTEYNPTSVMHYFCGGVGDINLGISDLDRIGALIVYPFAPVPDGLVSPVVVNAAAIQDAADLSFENQAP